MDLEESFLECAADFHGHLGPYLVLGLKMGLLARSILKGTHFALTAEIHTGKTPPYSCIVDGVQISSGCTLGKGNICIREDENLYGLFTKGETTVKIEIKKEILENIPHIPRDQLEVYARQIAAQKDEELFCVVS